MKRYERDELGWAGRRYGSERQRKEQLWKGAALIVDATEKNSYERM